MIDRYYPYGASVEELRDRFAESTTFARFVEEPAEPDDWQAHFRLKTEIIEELFPERKRPSQLAVGWAWSAKCGDALRELLQERGLWKPPPPSRPMTMCWRLRMTWRSLRMSFGF